MSTRQALGKVTITPKGAYDGSTTYYRLDTVTYNGSSYMAKDTTIGNLPTNTTYWELLAQKGDTGDTGSRGPQGEHGEPGGTPLIAASTSEMTDTSTVYVNTTDGHWYYYDGDSWEDGGVYQATAIDDFNLNRINENYSKLNEITIQVKNDGYVVYNTGLIDGLGSSKHSDYIVVDGYTNIEYKAVISSAGAAIAYFDKNKTYLKSISIQGDNSDTVHTGTVPDTAYYAIISVYGSSYYEYCYMKLSNTNGVYNEFSEIGEDIIELQDKTKYLNYQEKVIEFRPTNSGYISYNTGLEVSSDNAAHTDYIEINGYTNIEYNAYITSAGAEIAYYDENKTYLKTVSIQGTENNQIQHREIPNTAYYVIISVYAAASTIAKSFIRLYNPIYDYKTNIINKNILIFGDSITESCNINVNEDLESTSYTWRLTQPVLTWPIVIKGHYLTTEIRNYALSGASYGKQESFENPRLSLVDQVQIAINDKNNPNNIFIQNTFTPDIIIFAAGTNRHGNVATYENTMNKTIYEEDNQTIDVSATLNNLDLTNETEAARYCFMKIKEQWPLAQVYCVLPIQRVARDMLTDEFVVELHKLAIRYGCVIINGADNGIISEGNVLNDTGTTLRDGLHPNQNGQYIMARQIIKSLESNYLDLNVLSLTNIF